MAALGHTIVGDQILKNLLGDFAFEDFEIFAYKSRMTIAEAGGYLAATSGLTANLAEEQPMAARFDENLAQVTVKIISLKQAGATAKNLKVKRMSWEPETKCSLSSRYKSVLPTCYQ